MFSDPKCISCVKAHSQNFETVMEICRIDYLDYNPCLLRMCMIIM